MIEVYFEDLKKVVIKRRKPFRLGKIVWVLWESCQERLGKKLIGNKTFRAQIYVGDHEELVTEIERLFSHKKFAINIVPEYSRSVDQRKLLLNCFFLWRLAYLQGSWVRLQTPLPIRSPPQKKTKKETPKLTLNADTQLTFEHAIKTSNGISS